MTIPVVGIGASAGGLEAVRDLLAHLPANTGLAFVFVQHLDPTHNRNLTEILAKVSAIPVQHASDGLEIEPNNLYVMPPAAALEIANQKLRVTPGAPASSGPHMPIDHLLRSLANECGSRAVGVVLSGAGTDGALGLEAVKAAGGVTFGQDPTTAEFDSMPRAAIERGCVDFVLSPEAIAAELTKLGQRAYIAGDEPAGLLESAEVKDQFDPILTLLRNATGIDFTLYREKTVRRRILRRLTLRGPGSLEIYRGQLENDPNELIALRRDLLISVASFFRDPESFEGLKTLVFPRLAQHRPEGAAIRVWVPGCATGEEAYSIAIALQEHFDETGHLYPVRIFASDASATAVEKARHGKYGETIAEDVSPERLKRHFSKVEGGYQVSKALREMCVFSRHDLIQDPPFSKLDLISCRNVLIFFEGVRRDVIALFHYGLRADGFLMLGPSAGPAGSLFSKVEGSQSIYTKNETMGNRHPIYAQAVATLRNADTYQRTSGTPAGETGYSLELPREVERALLSRYRGAGVVVDETLEVLETLGHTAPYLALPAGRVSLNLLKLIPETGLFLEVEKLVREVKQSGERVRKNRIPHQALGAAGEVNVEVIPLGSSRPRALLVLFESAAGAPDVEQASDVDPKGREIARLKQELAGARERLLSMIEERQSSVEDTQNAAEEAISANEELKSLNEELETAKEELQSTNEELTTVNDQLRSNNAALKEARDFALSIIETAAAPLLVLDPDLRIKAANPAFYRAFRISPREADGQFLYIVANGCWDVPRMREVLQQILPNHKMVQDFQIEKDFPGIGRRVLMLSARQLGNLPLILMGIDDVTARSELDLRLAAIVESSDDAIVSKTLDGTIITWNSGAEAIFGYTAQEVIGRTITTLAPAGHENEIRAMMERVGRGESVRHLETKRRRKDGEIIDVSVTISPIQGQDGVITGVSVVARDITELKRRQQESFAKQKLESVGTLAGGIAHDFNNILGGIVAHTELALAELASSSSPAEELERIRVGGIRGAEIVQQLMMYAGQEREVLEPVDVSQVVQDILELLKLSVSKHALVETDFGRDLPPVRANPGQLRQLVMNLVTNASDAMGDRDGVIRVTTSGVTLGRDSSSTPSGDLAEGDYVQLQVSDPGSGMAAETQAHVFDPYFTTKREGHGLGLAVVQGIVRSLGGVIRIVSALGQGSTFQILLPCAERTAQPPRRTISREPRKELPSQQATVLVVEDEDLLRQGVSKMLQKMGSSVIETMDGSAALNLIRAHQGDIDILLLDITLPGASSREVFEEAKRLRPAMKVIATSAYSEEMATATLAGKADHFLRKPYRLSDLVDSIRELLSL